MTEEQSRALDRVVGRLSILRAELDPEERAILDALIIGDTPEVVAHAVTIDINAVQGRVKFDSERNVYRVAD
ncbi:MAG: hypothetical protein GTO18_15110 [Anaerolineales bacterium]|nr:hypothetical protein [Anaerolineales bacterium]